MMQLDDPVGFEKLRNNHGPVVGRTRTAIQFIELADEGQQILTLHVLDEALYAVAGKQFQAILVSHVGLGFALRRLHILEVGGDRFSYSESLTASDFVDRFDVRAVRFKFEGLATRAIDDLDVIYDLLALSAVLSPLDIVVPLGMGFDFAADTNLISVLTVRFDDGRVETPVFADFDFLEEIDAIFAAATVAAFGDVSKPLFMARGLGEVALNGHHDRHQGF